MSLRMPFPMLNVLLSTSPVTSPVGQLHLDFLDGLHALAALYVGCFPVFYGV